MEMTPEYKDLLKERIRRLATNIEKIIKEKGPDVLLCGNLATMAIRSEELYGLVIDKEMEKIIDQEKLISEGRCMQCGELADDIICPACVAAATGEKKE